MMGRRTKTGADAFEAFTPGLRQKLSWRRGRVRKIKRAANKQARRTGKLESRNA